jgi:imidazole glycerol-phosphate synthase subunit HisH
MASFRMRAVVVDTGTGNIRSVVRAVRHACGQASGLAASEEPLVTGDPDAVRRAEVVVVPGQGAFGSFADAMAGGLGEAIVERVRAGTPYLGICLGLQVLFESSAEATHARGLAVFAGRVTRLEAKPLPLPHIGWNTARFASSPDPPDYYYFAHSFAAVPADASLTLATTTYGAATFASAIGRDRILGVQFHPEKSQQAGLALLERFFAEARR